MLMHLVVPVAIEPSGSKKLLESQLGHSLDLNTFSAVRRVSCQDAEQRGEQEDDLLQKLLVVGAADRCK